MIAPLAQHEVMVGTGELILSKIVEVVFRLC